MQLLSPSPSPTSSRLFVFSSTSCFPLCTLRRTMPDPALLEAKQLLSSAIAPNASKDARRKFHTLLIALPTSPSATYESKSFFGTLVHKCFAEFEDLQDPAIDALLDLCEDDDEKIRIIGIKALGPTARADPRWVRGNTGVLLQLLASQDQELKYVRESLHTLLSVSPADVFSVMADDCRGSEEETGASRQNILKFLSPSSADPSTGISLDTRRALLESGKHTDVEDVFREEFLSVVSQHQHGQGGMGKDEKMTILNLVIPLSTVTGQNATTPTVKRVSHLIIDLVPPGSPAKEVQPVVQLFNTFISSLTLAPFPAQQRRENVLDPRVPITFFAKHGQATTQLALGNDVPSRNMVEGLKLWVEEALRGGAKGGDGEEEMDVETVREKVVKQILPALLNASKAFTYNRTLEKAGEMFEILFYTVYLFSTNPTDRRTTFIPPYVQDELRALAQQAFGLASRARNMPGAGAGAKWGVIRDLLEVLTLRKPLPGAGEGIVPTWKYSQVPIQVQPQTQTQTPTPRVSGTTPGEMRRPPPQGPRASLRDGRERGGEREFESYRDRGQRQYPLHFEPRRAQGHTHYPQREREQERERERENKNKEERRPGARPATPPLPSLPPAPAPAPAPASAPSASVPPIPLEPFASASTSAFPAASPGTGLNIRSNTTTAAAATDGGTGISINGANKRRREVDTGSDSARPRVGDENGDGDRDADADRDSDWDGGREKKKGRNDIDKDGRKGERREGTETSTSMGTVGAGAALLARITGGRGRMHTPPMAQSQPQPHPQDLQTQQQQPKLSLRDRLGPSVTPSPAHSDGKVNIPSSVGMGHISALDRLALGKLAASSPVPAAAATARSGMTTETNKPAQISSLNIAGIASAAQTQGQAQSKDNAAGQGNGTDQTSMSTTKSIKIRRDNRPPPTTLFHRNYSSNNNIEIWGSRGEDEKEEEEEEEDEPVVKKGRGFVEKQEDVVMFEPPKESGWGTAFRQSSAGGHGGGQGVWRASAHRGGGVGPGAGSGMARGMFGARGAARR